MTGRRECTSIESIGGTGRFENDTGIGTGTGQQHLKTLASEHHIQSAISSGASSTCSVSTG